MLLLRFDFSDVNLIGLVYLKNKSRFQGTWYDNCSTNKVVVH